LSAVTKTASANMDCVPAASANAMSGSTALPSIRVTVIGGAGSLCAGSVPVARSSAAIPVRRVFLMVTLVARFNQFERI